MESMTIYIFIISFHVGVAIGVGLAYLISARSLRRMRIRLGLYEDEEDSRKLQPFKDALQAFITKGGFNRRNQPDK